MNPDSFQQESSHAVSSGFTEESSFASPNSGIGPEGSTQDKKSPTSPPRWVQIIPYFLSAFFFLSAFLAVFAPLPILFSYFKKGRSWAWLALITNAGLVLGIQGGLGFALYLIFIASVSVTLPEFIRRKKSFEKSVVFTLLVMAGVATVIALGYGQVKHVNPIHEIHQQISLFIDYLGQSVSSSSNLMNSADLDEWKRSVLVEFPSNLAIFSLIIVWANFLLLIRFNPNRIRESLGLDPGFFKKWKAPELLVWPTILTGVFLLFDAGITSDVAFNIFRFLMAVYTIQGLSILSYLFDIWGIKGFFRILGYSLSLFLMMPLVLSLGFFDLWFDFRGKFRQS